MTSSPAAATTGAKSAATTPREIRAYLRTPNVAARIKRLQRLSTLRFCAQIGLDYGTIALAIVLATSAWGEAWFAVAYPLAVIIIAARQHALAILMHETSHYLASPNRRVNEWLGSLFCAAPILANMQNYRRAHLAHHTHLNTAEDPDWQRKTQSAEERN
jgi:fatty acid desaturase